jgi:uncharacterized membrane protein YbhN (UPF0104 family)
MLNRKHWFRIASALISIVTILLLIHWVKTQGSLKIPTDSQSLSLIVGAIAVYLSSFVVRGLRWKILLSEVGVKPPLHEATGLLTVGYAGNTVLPARAGDAVRVFLMSNRTGAKASLMVSTLIAERLLDVFALGTAFVITSLMYSHGVPTGTKADIAFGVFIVGLICLGVLVWVVRTNRLPEGVLGLIRDASLGVRQLRGSKHLFQVLGLTICAWTLEMCVYILCAKAATITLTPGQAVYILSTAAMFTLIPSGPGFAGTMDAAILYTMTRLHVSKALIAPFVIILRVVVFIPITILGGLLLVTRYGGFAALKAAQSAQGEENEEAEAAARAHLPLDADGNAIQAAEVKYEHERDVEGDHRRGRFRRNQAGARVNGSHGAEAGERSVAAADETPPDPAQPVTSSGANTGDPHA